MEIDVETYAKYITDTLASNDNEVFIVDNENDSKRIKDVKKITGHNSFWNYNTLEIEWGVFFSYIQTITPNESTVINHVRAADFPKY
ncbi:MULTISPECIES: hypothetical protein [unclassified Lactobacillus]|uniref:hypothetical protein n=1 Tax=unclassified Lactobacillus TaxID=2620435 RepID=UPI00226B0D6B|nr:MULTISPECIES: hypothetical protein [unclassified Lactobacillus]MCO6533162.1 hypothetical protein [Lactobacillus sp.]MCX8737008.1 hypothetical protein [Lactobacillus sp. B4026]